MSGKPYPKDEYIAVHAETLLQCSRSRDKVVEVPRELPCSVIVVHGVNDVGTGYSAVETGLCAGLQVRLKRRFKPASYRLPVAADKGKLLDDPDAVFFKRDATPETDSPIIPFYWGFREQGHRARNTNGQKTDFNGNRLDKDLSKGGGPFGNATSTLPDMWNRGLYALADAARDPLRPLKTGPGRMYMVLAAQRLAALISMIRGYEPKDTVNVVAHSQGCLVSLLAQAFLMEMGERTADTIILTHPPYGLDEEMGKVMTGVNYFQGDKDAAMHSFYGLIEGQQTVHARVQTLVNIVAGVAKSKASEPAFSSIAESECNGAVHNAWNPVADRDNRGKIYLYFCPEDMTVALDNMRGIGWQGVPDHIPKTSSSHHNTMVQQTRNTRPALAELGPNFRQRVFTAKRRATNGSSVPTAVLVGRPPHDFVVRLKGEDDHAHVVEDGRTLRASLPVVNSSPYLVGSIQDQRYGIRTINGEALASPVPADIRGSQVDAGKIPSHSRWGKPGMKGTGPCEEVDPIDAAIALTGIGGLGTSFEILPAHFSQLVKGPAPQKNAPPEVLSPSDRAALTDAYNAYKFPGKKTDPNNRFCIIAATRDSNGKIIANVQESPNAARLRWQKEYSPKSFHSVIFGSQNNHRQVTAYDLSIGSGKAVSDPLFRAYLCAVADWRLRSDDLVTEPRPGMLTRKRFMTRFARYLSCEPEWHMQLITGNADYYNSGQLPKLPLLTGPLWNIVISETTGGERVFATA